MSELQIELCRIERQAVAMLIGLVAITVGIMCTALLIS
jgi:hypothetical protein